ncbi:MAG: type II toxin-antitoxin system VapC family toxin [Chloroflexota bacterium]
MKAALLDTDTLSEIMKSRDPGLQQKAVQYLTEHGHFTFSIITRYEILRGLMTKGAARQIALFDERCARSEVLPLSEEIIANAAGIYADLSRRGQLITDADILIAASALVHSLVLVTGNTEHFKRIPDLNVEDWRTPRPTR